MDLLLTHHIVEFICIDSCRIDHVSRLENSIVCMDFPAFIYWFKIRNFRIKLKLHAVCICILCHCDVHIERTYDTRCRCIKCSAGFIGNIRFHFFQFLTVKDPQLLNTICNTSVVQCMKLWHILFMQTYDQRSVFLKRKIKIFGKLLHHLISTNIQFCHQ